jgi:AI-2 transport protein TqsA
MDKRFTDTLFFKGLCVTLFTLIIVWTLIYFKELLKPIALGVVIWYLIKAFNGLVEKVKFRGKPLNIWLRRGIALLVTVGIIEGSVSIFVSSIKQIINNYPLYQQSLNTLLADAGNTLGVANVADWLEVQVSELNIPGFLSDILGKASSLIGNIFLVIIYTIFIVLEESAFAKKLALVMGHDYGTNRILDQIYSSTNKYVAVKAFVSALTAVLGYVVLIIVGVDFAFLWSLLIFALNFIPYVGSIISTLLPALFSIVQFGSPWPALWVFGGIMTLHTIIGNYVEPKIMGKSLNLSPLVVLITLSFWGYVWDLLGMLLSVPITSILLITFAQFPATRGIAILMTENGDIESLQNKQES